MNEQSIDLGTIMAAAAGMEGDGHEAAENDPAADARIIKEWINRIDQDIEFHKPAFDKMEEDMAQANGSCWQGVDADDERYSANITQRVVRQRVAALYAKNPTFVAKRVERLDFAIWDGDPMTLQRAADRAAMAMQSGMPPDPMDMDLLADVKRGWDRRKFIDRMGRTLELVMQAQIRNQERPFKREMKDMLRRQEITGVGWIKLDYIREMDVDPDVESRLNDLGNRVAALEAQQQEVGENNSGDIAVELKKLRILQESIESQKYIMRREGIVFRFPKSDAIIPHKDCVRLEGFIGARWVTERFSLPDSEIKRIYKVDVCKDESGGYAAPDKNWKLMDSQTARPKNLARPSGNRDVFLVYDMDSGTQFTICRGYDKYLVPPTQPPVTVEQFYPYYLIAFNQMENNKSVWPNSTARLMRPMQLEYNRAKESLRQHRIASAPLYVSGTGALSDEDKKNFRGHAPHDCIELDNLAEGQAVETKLAMVKKYPIDPNVYETASIMEDVSRVTGVTATGMSIIKGGTATESAIAEDSHQSDVGSSADDQDDQLSILMRDAGHTLLINMDVATVKKQVGPGAVWPDMGEDEIIQDIYLDIEAGSSGRPNVASDAAIAQRVMPFLQQVPGVNPAWVAKKMVRLLDQNVSYEDAILEGHPAITAMNQMSATASPISQNPSGDPAADPMAQGAQGAMNAPVGPRPDVLPGAGMPGAAGAQEQRAGGMISRIMGRMRGA